MPAPHWPLPGELRMPLQIGHSALVEGAFAAGAAVNATALALAHVQGGGWLALVVALALVACTVLWIAGAWSSLSGCRASDLVLGPAGFRVEGGPHHRLALPWTDIVIDRCHVVDGSKHLEGEPLRGHLLILGTTDGREHIVAEAYQEPDRDALRAALDEIRAVFGLAPVADAARHAPPPAAPAPVADVDVLRCSSCGASAAPADMSHVPCPMCQAKVAVPPAVRARLAGDAALAREAEAARPLIRRLLDQPGAAVTNRRLFAAHVVVFLVPLAGGLAYAALRQRGLDSSEYLVGSFLAVAALIVLVTVLATPMLARRVALRACLLDLGARHDGGPRCRACGAALPDQHQSHVLVRCPWCRCDNILGVDLRPFQAAADSRRASLRGLLDQRRVRLGGVLGDALLCLLLAVAAGIWPVLAWLE